MTPKIIRTDTLMSTRYLNLMFCNWESKEGRICEWVYAERPAKKNAVVIAAVTHIPTPKLVVTREYRPPLQAYEWGLPAGLIDDGESIEETVTRELKEETGLDVEYIKRETPLIYNSSGLTNEGCYMVFVEVSGDISQNNLQDNEDITTCLLDKNQINGLLSDISRPECNDKLGAKAYLIFDRFATYGDI